jgi:hypothetical protein
MPAVDGLDVRILVSGKSLTEYSSPDGDHDEVGSRKRIRYIEVEAGQAFAVQTRLLQGFKLQHAPGIYIEATVDDADFYCYRHYGTNEIRHNRGTVLNDITIDTYTGPCHWDDAVGRWKNAQLTFGALGISELIQLCASSGNN